MYGAFALAVRQVPELLEVLSAVVRVEGVGLAIKRNQVLVLKYLMQAYGTLAHVLELPHSHRYRHYHSHSFLFFLIQAVACNSTALCRSEEVLLGHRGASELQYLLNLVDLLATCAEVLVNTYSYEFT